MSMIFNKSQHISTYFKTTGERKAKGGVSPKKSCKKKEKENLGGLIFSIWGQRKQLNIEKLGFSICGADFSELPTPLAFIF